MHGTQTAMSRAGRKRKSGIRFPSGGLRGAETSESQLRAEVAAGHPHRQSVPKNLRTDHRAESELGRMALRGQISDDHYTAGQKLAAIVGDYRAVIDPPRALAGTGKGFGCKGEADCHLSDECECRRRKQRYDDAFDALMTAGRDAVKAVKAVAVYDEFCQKWYRTYLRWGLSALVQHFGLTGKAKSAYSRN